MSFFHPLSEFYFGVTWGVFRKRREVAEVRVVTSSSGDGIRKTISLLTRSLVDEDTNVLTPEVSKD